MLLAIIGPLSLGAACLFFGSLIVFEIVTGGITS